MIVKGLLRWMALPWLGLTAGVASAHHSFAAEFGNDKGSIVGEVVEVVYANPHVRYFVEVVGEDGEAVIWSTQTLSISYLSRAGWTEDLIRAGDRVVVNGSLGLNNANKLFIDSIELPDGRTVTLRGLR